MRKAEIVQRIAQELACTTAQAAAAVEAILTTIKASLRQGEPAIAAWRVVRFTAGQPFKQAVDAAAHLVE
jgi:nucleoid DNA-binding protein